jgi:hypothetical protein
MSCNENSELLTSLIVVEELEEKIAPSASWEIVE